MNQPELGNKIAGIRKEKGFTQQEVADKSGINIRTIQRIESGEVTPRTYTIRQFLHALDLTYEQVFDQETDKSSGLLKAAWIHGIIYFILGFPEVYLGGMLMEGGLTPSQSILFLVIKIQATISYIFFIHGFTIIGKINHLPLLTIASKFLMIFAAAFALFESLAVFEIVPIEGVMFSESISFGIVGILFGIALFRSEKITGRLGILAGILEVTAAMTFLTFVLAFIGLFILAPAEILEILILYFAATKSRKIEFAT